MTIAPDSVVARAPGLAQRLFEERMLIITSRDSMLHRFNEVGTFIWGLLEKPRHIAEIVEAIAARFDGFDKKKNRAEIVAFLAGLAEKGLVRSEEVPCTLKGRGRCY
ncbi:MAG: PqqD family protein [Chitinispirillaceae bacterium]|nr:PqqD family protein [Chitinispirillaceae bacterium]